MQPIDSMLQMLGLSKYSSNFRKHGLTDVASVMADPDKACGLLATRRDRDVLQGYLSVRASRSSDASELSERRESIFRSVKDALRRLDTLQGRRAAVLEGGSKNEIADLLDAIDDAKEALQTGKTELERLELEGRRPAAAEGAMRGDSYRVRAGTASNSTRTTYRAPPTYTAELPSSQPPRQTRMDPNNWNRTAPMNRVERMTLRHASRRTVSQSPIGLHVSGTKASLPSLGAAVPAHDQMRCGANMPRMYM